MHIQSKILISKFFTSLTDIIYTDRKMRGKLEYIKLIANDQQKQNIILLNMMMKRQTNKMNFCFRVNRIYDMVGR